MKELKLPKGKAPLRPEIVEHVRFANRIGAASIIDLPGGMISARQIYRQ